MSDRSLQRILVKRSSSLTATHVAFLVVASCSSVPKPEYILELGGVQNSSCEVTNDKVLVGTFVVPATINLGSNVGDIEASCVLDDTPVSANILIPKPDCRDQIIVKGPCSQPTASVGSVEIVIRQSR